jgi:hypothetical protein
VGRPRGQRRIRDDIGFARVFYPERVPALERELAEAVQWSAEHPRPKREDIERASHVRMEDGWAEVVRVVGSEVVVAVGENPEKRVPFKRVLEVKSW